MIVRASAAQLNGPWGDLLRGLVGNAGNVLIGGQAGHQGTAAPPPIVVQMPAPVAPPPPRQGISTGAAIGIAAAVVVAVFLFK